MWTALQYRFLRLIAKRDAAKNHGCAYKRTSDIASLLGAELLQRIQNKTVIDFGCGNGADALAVARAGARKVIGIDLREDALARARRSAAQSGLADICQFATCTDELADVILCIDSFEHFENPDEILHIMDSLLRPSGEVLISFGPTWYHPLGGHLFSVFPWAHLIFSEQALIRWRADFKHDGAKRFGEIAGGLNQITIKRFEAVVERSPFQFASMETVPIRKLGLLHNRMTREFTTATVRCRLVKPAHG